MSRAWLARFVVAASLVAGSASAQSAPDKAACAAAHEQAQRLKLRGELRRARTELLQCAREACASWVVSECTTLLADVERALPTVVFVASRRDAGRTVDLADVVVTVDGERVAERIDGRDVALDPGTHVVRFEPADRKFSPREEKIVVHANEKGRRVEMTFGEPAPLPPAPPPVASGLPWTVYALGGVALAGLGSFAFFGGRGLSEEHDVLDRCDPRCSDAQIDSVRTKYLVADVSLAVSLLAAGGALWIALTNGTKRASTASR